MPLGASPSSSSIGSVVVCLIDIVLQGLGRGLQRRMLTPDNWSERVIDTFRATSQKGRGNHVEFHVGQSVAASVRSAARDCAALYSFSVQTFVVTQRQD